MDFGKSILSTTPADWVVDNGSITASSITLNAGGTATLELVASDLKSMPEAMKLIMTASNYPSKYFPYAYATIKVVSEGDKVKIHTIPIVDMLDGRVNTIVETTSGVYKELYFSIRTSAPLVITELSLSTPVINSDGIDVDGILEEIPKLLSDYNIDTFSVAQREKTIALISMRLKDNTDISGHLQLTYVASEASTITIRFKDNTSSELFAPILYDVNKGRGSIGVPHSYLKRLLGLHTLTVTAQCNVGTIIFNTRKILYTVDTGYLAVRLMDIDLSVEDIALRRLKGEDGPSSIYAVGVDKDGTTRVRYRPYNDNALLLWEPAYSLPPSINAAIEFNGSFVVDTDGVAYTIDCEEFPWVFWIDHSSILYGQLGTDEATLIKLAEGVLDVSAVRGYKSSLLPNYDQGLIVAYIINGAVKYRSYAYDAIALTYAWGYEVTLSQLGSVNESIQLHRLNDYRVGFVATSPTEHNWLITERTYVNEASAPETLRLKMSNIGSNFASMYIGEEVKKATYSTSTSEDGLSFLLTSSVPIVIKDDFYSSFTLTSTKPVRVSSYSVINNTVEFKLASSTANNIVTIEPIGDNVAYHYLDNGYVTSRDTYVFAFAYKSNEYISMLLKSSASFIQEFSGPIDVTAKEETIELNLKSSSTLIQELIETIQSTAGTENIEMSLKSSSSLVQYHTSEIPS